MTKSSFLWFTLCTILAAIAFVNYQRVQLRNEVIQDREQTITAYKTFIEAMAKTQRINMKKLKTQLRSDFNLKDQMEYREADKEYYYLLFTKNNEIRHQEIWDFMGLEMTLDKNKRLKTLNLFKP